MEDKKSIFLSKTFWGAVMAILAAVAGLFGLQFSEADQAELLGSIDKLVVIGGGLFAIYGRVTAKSKIG